jgi:hypothetical protein
MAITLGTPVIRPDGLTQRSFTQSAAALDEVLVADPGSVGARDGRIVVFDICFALTVAGTAQLKGGTTGALTGAMPWGITPARINAVDTEPALVCAVSESLTISTTLGAAIGYIVYRVRS